MLIDLVDKHKLWKIIFYLAYQDLHHVNLLMLSHVPTLIIVFSVLRLMKEVLKNTTTFTYPEAETGVAL